MRAFRISSQFDCYGLWGNHYVARVEFDQVVAL